MNDTLSTIRKYQSSEIDRMLAFLKEIGEEETIREFLSLCRPYTEEEE